MISKGCFLGALISLALGEQLGRRMCIMIGSAVLVVGTALQTSAYSIPHLIVGRILAGIGNGLNTSTIRKIYGNDIFLQC
jgi:predicted MFS family arabinose efflux permease